MSDIAMVEDPTGGADDADAVDATQARFTVVNGFVLNMRPDLAGVIQYASGTVSMPAYVFDQLMCELTLNGQRTAP